MFYTVYKVTNKINNKIYVGVHKTSNIDDGYMGSGVILKRALAKYGIENFEKEILESFDDCDAMFDMETKIVNDDFVSDSMTYNLKLGGSGGYDYIHNNGLNNIADNHKKASAARSLKMKNDPEFRERHRQQVSKTMTQTHKDGKIRYDTFTGKTHSEETKAKISEANSKLTGEKNSQFGSMWITDGSQNKKIKKSDTIPEGWVKGRKLK